MDRRQERDETVAWEVLGLSIQFLDLLLLATALGIFNFKLGDRINLLSV
jgi:hypothetical protein